MTANQNIPERLYKYMPVNNRSLSAILSDTLFFANPTSFNDPLDCNPVLDIDLPIEESETILKRLICMGTGDRMTSAARTMRVQGPRVQSHIDRHGREEADRVIDEIGHASMFMDGNREANKRSMIKYRIKREILNRYNHGIVALSEKVSCPLMWSHYGDQHAGMCIGYSVPKRNTENLHKVNYCGPGLIRTSMVRDMLDEKEDAKGKIMETALLQKGQDWSYEREWRLIGNQGEWPSILEMEEIIFGVRCRLETKFIVMTALKGRERPVHFYTTHLCSDGTFRLEASGPCGEEFGQLPWRSSWIDPLEVMFGI